MNLFLKLNIRQNRNFLGIGISIILLIGLIISPNIQLDVYGQNNNNTGIDQEIQDIVKKVTTTNPDIKADNLRNLLSILSQTLTKSIGQEKTKGEIQVINLQITKYPKGVIVHSLNNLTKQLVSSSSTTTTDKNVISIVNQIIQERLQGKDISQSIVNTAVKYSALNQKSKMIDQLITKSSQILSKEGKVSSTLAESALKQFYLHIAKSKGIGLADKSIKEIADILTKQPKCIMVKALAEFIKIYENNFRENDNLLNIIKQIVSDNNITCQNIGQNKDTKAVIVNEKTTPIQSQQQSHKYSSNACPAKNVQHWDKIVFVIKSADLAKRLKLPLNSELDIKVLDDPTKVADLKKNVLNFLKVPNEPRSSIEILQVKYAMICVA